MPNVTLSAAVEQLSVDALDGAIRVSTGVLLTGLSVLLTLVWTAVSHKKKYYGDVNKLRGPTSTSWLMGK